MLPNIRILRILTLLLLICLVIVSIFGAFIPWTYARDADTMAAQGIGQDFVNLVLVVPLLLISFLLMTKGSKIATLIYGGTLFYILYSFIIYAFGVHFNRLFLLYCAILGLSVYAFIIYMSDIQKENVAAWFKNAPAKLISVYIMLVAFLFYTLWLKTLIPSILNNSVPAEISDSELLVNPVHVIDLSFALPALIIGSVLMWKGKKLGFVISSLALIFTAILSIALAGMVIMMVKREVTEDFSVAIIFGIITLTGATAAIMLFRKIK